MSFVRALPSLLNRTPDGRGTQCKGALLLVVGQTGDACARRCSWCLTLLLMAMQVSLFRYPALGGRGKVYGGHSSHVTAVRFSADGKQLFSSGGGDACILHWAVEGTTKPPASSTERTPRVSQEVEAAPVPLASRLPASSLPQG